MHCAGPASTSGLKLQSFRSIGGLSAEVSIPRSFQAFPGIINGGIISTLFDCHGNWSAAIALMDKAALPRPPFTLSHSIQVRLLDVVSHAVTAPDLFCLKMCAKVVRSVTITIQFLVE